MNMMSMPRAKYYNIYTVARNNNKQTNWNKHEKQAEIGKEGQYVP